MVPMGEFVKIGNLPMSLNVPLLQAHNRPGVLHPNIACFTIDIHIWNILPQRRNIMAHKPTPEFRAEAVRVAWGSGLPRKQVAADFA